MIREDYDTQVELAVVNRVAAHDETIIVYAWDGENDYVRDNTLILLGKAFQEVFNAGPFKHFREAAVKGTRKTKRIALGKRYPMVCLGRSFDGEMKGEPAFDPEPEPERVTPGADDEEKGPVAGNNEKDDVDLHDELAAKGLVSAVQLETVEDVEDTSSINGVGVVTLAIAALAYSLYAA